MSDELLQQYNRELAYLRRAGAEFAASHPKIAGRLRLGQNEVEDPHVARLIESAAFLNARTRLKLEDDFPELTDALLSVLYPHYLAPIPSCTILQFSAPPDLSEPIELAAGTAVETERTDIDPVRYRTCYPTTLVPLEVTRATLRVTPFEAPITPHSNSATAVLRLTLEGAQGGAPISEILPDRLRFYLGGPRQNAHWLYELLLNDVLQVAVATSATDSRPDLLDPAHIVAVGFAEDEGLLPYPDRSALSYRLLTEYFAFPEKFLFVDIVGPWGAAVQRATRKLELFFYLRRTVIDLQQSLSTDDFALGCAPAVNLFEKRAEPVKLRHQEPEVRVVPDARRPMATEVHSIDAVTATSLQGEARTYRPFYGVEHRGGAEERSLYYHAVRRAAESSGGKADNGTEVFLQLVDLDFDPAAPADHVLVVETTCSNRDLPSKLPFGGGQPRVRLAGPGGPVAGIRCLTHPTPTRRPRAGRPAFWKLVSHLSLNHLSLSNDPRGVESLKEILRLYDYVGDDSRLRVIESVTKLTAQPATLRVVDGIQAGFSRGTAITLELDERAFADHGLFLFASVLEVFFGLYCSLNSFVRVAVRSNAREGVIHQWPARSGTKTLL